MAAAHGVRSGDGDIDREGDTNGNSHGAIRTITCVRARAPRCTHRG